MSMTERLFNKSVSYNKQLSFPAYTISAMLTSFADSVQNGIMSFELAINFAQNLIVSNDDNPANQEDELVMEWIDSMYAQYTN